MNPKTDWPETEEKENSDLLSRRVSKEGMDNLVQTLLLGGDLSKATDETTTPGTPGTGGEDGGGPGKSQQIDDFQQMAAGEFVPPRYNPLVWALAITQNTRLARCIRSYARNTVGLGWKIEPIHPITPETPDAERKAIEEQSEVLRAFFSHPNEKMPFTEVANLMKVDEETIGNGYWEVVRNNAGKIVRLHHAPGTTIRKRLMKSENGQKPEVYGYVQIRGNQKRYFKEFGDKRVMDAMSGAWYSGDQALESKRRATEILHFLIYDPNSSYYGGPRYVPASAAIAGNRQAAIRNVAFFENDAVPRLALLVSGGRLTQESMQQVEDFFRGKAKGTDQAHRVMILQIEPSKVGFQQANKTMIELKPLTVGVNEDSSFQAYRKDNDEEVREIFGMAPVFFSTENVNKASAAVSREITNEQEFEPDRLTKEYIINQTIVMDLLATHMGNDPKTFDDPEVIDEMRKQIRVQFRFARLTLTDPLDQARMDQIYATLGGLTPNELRERLGKPPYPKEYFFADKPLTIALAELSAGLALAISLDPAEEYPAELRPGAAAPGGGAGGEGGGPEGVRPPGSPKPPAAKPAAVSELPKPDATGLSKPKPAKLVGTPRFKSEKSWAIVQELMQDARRLAEAGSNLHLDGGRNGS